MTTITVPVTTYDDGRKGPDLTGLEGYVSATLDPGGETYTVQMPAGWRAPGVLSRREFMARITTAEWVAVEERADSDYMIRHWLRVLTVADEVRLDDPDTMAAVQYAEQIGLIAEGRAAEILTP